MLLRQIFLPGPSLFGQTTELTQSKQTLFIGQPGKTVVITVIPSYVCTDAESFVFLSPFHGKARVTHAQYYIHVYGILSF